MHHLCRWLSPILVLASLAIVAMASPATAGPTPADGNGRPASGPVVVVGLPDLRWQDVDPGGTPTLWRLAGRSSIAAMTDRAGERITSRTAGWLTVNTGSRARAGVNPTVASGPAAVPDPADPAQLQALRLLNRSARYRSQVGALGDALHHAGRTVAAAGGPGALLGAMTGGGSVDSTAPTV